MGLSWERFPVPEAGCSVLSPSSSNLESVILFPLMSRKGALDVLLFWGSLAVRRGLSVFDVQGGVKTTV